MNMSVVTGELDVSQSVSGTSDYAAVCMADMKAPFITPYS